MDVPDQDRVARTPEATKVALLGTLAAVVLTVAAFEAEAPAERARACLALYTALFALRVVGQIVVAVRSPRWLPPMEQWNLVPYRILLPAQVGLLALMCVIALDVAHGRGPFAGPNDELGLAFVGLSYVYWAAMAVRYAVRMRRRPEQRWFGGAIPIVFHCVLAAFLFVWGSYLAAG